MPNAQAAICRLGHTAARDVKRETPPNRCEMCGRQVLVNCLGCGSPITGPAYELQQGPVPPRLVKVWRPGAYEPPPQCERCGYRHPWAF